MSRSGSDYPASDDDGYASPLARLFLQEDINFLVTNRLPRHLVTRIAGWYSRIESPLLARASIALWKLFADDLELQDALRTDFRSLHDCFVRELKPEARPIDPNADVLVSPCDAIVGAHGRVRDGMLVQAKGFPYALGDLLGDDALVDRHRDGWYVTLRLKANMYHRFHAPVDARVHRITYVSGDCWNVNPIALRRVEQLFCKNERAIVELETGIPDVALTMVPVAAILVASMRFRCLPTPLTLAHRGRTEFTCDAEFAKGEEIGHFEAGSTIVLFASGPWAFCPEVREGRTLRMGQPLMRLPAASQPPFVQPADSAGAHAPATFVEP